MYKKIQSADADTLGQLQEAEELRGEASVTMSKCAEGMRNAAGHLDAGDGNYSRK